MRELHVGEDVLWPDGSQAGAVERIVVDESAHRVTHLVVDGRLVALGKLRDAGPDGLVVDLERAAFEKLPRVEHGHVVGPGEHWKAPSGFTLGNFLAVAEALVGQSPYIPPVQADLDADTLNEITVGSPLWSGGDRLGEVERLLTGDAGELRELVVRRGGVLAGHARVPVERVLDVVGNNVHVDLTRDELEQLPEYREPAEER